MRNVDLLTNPKSCLELIQAFPRMAGGTILAILQPVDTWLCLSSPGGRSNYKVQFESRSPGPMCQFPLGRPPPRNMSSEGLEGSQFATSYKTRTTQIRWSATGKYCTYIFSSIVDITLTL